MLRNIQPEMLVSSKKKVSNHNNLSFGLKGTGKEEQTESRASGGGKQQRLETEVDSYKKHRTRNLINGLNFSNLSHLNVFY